MRQRLLRLAFQALMFRSFLRQESVIKKNRSGIRYLLYTSVSKCLPETHSSQWNEFNRKRLFS